ncbi:MAG TPA: hypothetical protein VMG12_21275 [Polyangiaceae bacterium]|nr:hypothetical protein [Polyangiaceae bacterium]
MKNSAISLPSAARALAFSLPALGALACDDGATVIYPEAPAPLTPSGPSTPAPSTGDDTPAGGLPAPAAGPTQNEPIYLYTVAVYAPDGTLQYSLLRHELNMAISVDDLATAREFPGYTGVAAIDGQVVTGDSETPFATRFSIGDDLSWTPVGERLNFGDYFSDDADGLNFYFQSIRGSDMYFFYGADRTSRVHWNTERWRIEGDHRDTALPTRAGWTLSSTGNRTGVRDYVGPVVQSYNMSNDATGLVSDESWLAVYDPDTHAERAVLEVPCPGIQQATKDEDGNLYFATTFNQPTLALYNRAPKPCVVKLKADGTLDESFAPNDLTAFTGGYYGVNFRYLRDGIAVANVLHHDRMTDVDFGGEVDPDVEVRIGGRWTDDGYLPEDASLWELELLDLNAGTSRVVEGFSPGHDVSFYTIFFQVDGRTFISVQHDVDSITHNAMYELDIDAARVTSIGEVVGDLAGVERVR